METAISNIRTLFGWFMFYPWYVKMVDMEDSKKMGTELKYFPTTNLTPRQM